MRVAFYGDDFTGSVDALLQFARHGMPGRLFVGTPERVEGVEVIGVAGIARSLSGDDLDAEVGTALTELVALNPEILQYKASSTADSSPTVGNLGRVIELGREATGTDIVPVLFAQPDFGRYTVFGHHFAAEGGTVHRLDRQPTMSRHPSTPMSESDLVHHLAAQTRLPIAAVHFPEYADAAALGSRLAPALAAPSPASAALVLDALTPEHLELVGAALWGLTAAHSPVFVLGSGGLSWGLGAAAAASRSSMSQVVSAPSTAAGNPTPGTQRSATADAGGPVLVVSGSRSPQTRRQADAARTAGWLVRPLPVPADPAITAEVLAALAHGRSVALTSDDAELTASDPLPAIAAAAASVVFAAARAGATGRVIVCGGDTSSRIVTLLGVRSLSIHANPTGNVVLLDAHSPDPAIDGLLLLLKGGQVGDDDLFEDIRALQTT